MRPSFNRTRWEETYRDRDENLDVLQSVTQLPYLLSAPQELLLGKSGSSRGPYQPTRDLISSAEDKWKIAALVAAIDAVGPVRADCKEDEP